MRIWNKESTIEYNFYPSFIVQKIYCKSVKKYGGNVWHSVRNNVSKVMHIEKEITKNFSKKYEKKKF